MSAAEPAAGPGCCAPGQGVGPSVSAAPAAPEGTAEIRESVRSYYTARLEAGGCCGDGASPAAADAGDDALAATPSFGCGQPTVFAELDAGESVLDLGSGAGLDAFRAARAVGPTGRVLGVDMTPAMLARARDGAAKLGLGTVAFREGFIEALPVEDASIDVVLSNCVVNLSQDKAAVFGEAFRVLRPGGRLAISDVLRNGPRLTAASEEGWCACIDGAETPERYRELLRAAGFADIAVDAPPEGVATGETYSASVRARRPALRPADAGDLPAVAALLGGEGLPEIGLAADVTRLFVLDGAPGAIDAVVGFEGYGEHALLRSLAVRPALRGRGYGEALLRHALRETARAGANVAYGLTTTIPELLQHWGFEEVDRGALPAELAASAELRGACPASARAFRKTLGPPPR